MESGLNSKLNFCARNKTIRFADDLAREVNKQFPTFSLSKTNYWSNRYKFENLRLGKNKMEKRHRKSFNKLADIIWSKKKNHTKFSEMMDVIKKSKTANCLERALLALIMATCSGIKNCSIQTLVDNKNRWLDHAVLYVADKKSPYIIDPWLGFADYLPKAFEKYNSEFRQYFCFMSKRFYKDLQFVKLPMGDFPFKSLYSSKGFTPLSILKFANERPELFIQFRRLKPVI